MPNHYPALLVIPMSLILVGCHPQSPQPFAVPRPREITIEIYRLPEIGIDRAQTVVIRAENRDDVLRLVSPSNQKISEIDRSLSKLIGYAYLKFDDGKEMKIFLRYMGHNPLAVSIDDDHFFFGGMSKYVDGTIELMHLLDRK